MVIQIGQRLFTQIHGVVVGVVVIAIREPNTVVNWTSADQAKTVYKVRAVDASASRKYHVRQADQLFANLHAEASLPRPVQHEVRYMAGDCRTGNGRRRIKWHVLATPNCAGQLGGHMEKALCGKRPAIQWSDARAEQPATCPACLKRLNALG